MIIFFARLSYFDTIHN